MTDEEYVEGARLRATSKVDFDNHLVVYETVIGMLLVITLISFSG